MTTAIIASAGIDQIEAARHKIIGLYREAFDKLLEASDLVRVVLPGGVQGGLPWLHDSNKAWGLNSDDLEEAVRRPLDRSIWKHLLYVTQLDRLMDTTAKEQFHNQLEKDPPPATADNCRATVEQLIGDADTIFKRGIATAFSRLDRRFRSHDGFKIGSRIVISYFANDMGYVNSRREDILQDVERTFSVLDGKEVPGRAGGIIGELRNRRRERGGLNACAYEAETDYFRVKVFKNGNAHVYFKRDELVERVNLLLADYYGATLGAGADAAEKKHEPNRTPAKNFGLFETPIALADKVIDEAHVWTDRTVRRGQSIERLKVLEPSAGPGRLALRAAGWGHRVTAVEIQPHLAAGLASVGALERVVSGDFLDQTPEVLGLFDRVIMNPPFDGQRDIDHVTHAARFLAPGGRLVAIMSASTAYRENAKAEAFRALVERMRGRIEDLPEGSFKESGTMVNTVLVTLNA